MGGDSSQRNASLASGLNAWLALRHQADIQVSCCSGLQLYGNTLAISDKAHIFER